MRDTGVPGVDRYGVAESTAVERRVGFFLAPTFAMLPFVSALEPLRAANRYSRRPLYAWQCHSLDGAPVAACNGMQQAVDGDLASAGGLDLLVVCGPHDPLGYRDKRLFQWLRQQAALGVALAALDTGSLLLARAGLLDGCRCTLHWENLPGFVEEFPAIEVSGELFAIDGRRYTCAGGTAALDMMLWLIGQQHGYELAAQVSDLFIHSAIRQQQQPQRMNLRTRTGVSHPRLLECIELMEANVEQPLTLCELAEVTGTSKRQLERLFRRYLHSSPGRYYLQLRLRAGRKLLEQTSLPIIEVACACGFSSAGHFSQRFRTLFGQTPREARAAP